MILRRLNLILKIQISNPRNWGNSYNVSEKIKEKTLKRKKLPAENVK